MLVACMHSKSKSIKKLNLNLLIITFKVKNQKMIRLNEKDEIIFNKTAVILQRNCQRQSIY